MIVAASRGLRPDGVDLVGGVAFGQHLVDPDDRPTVSATSARSPVTRHDAADPGLAQRRIMRGASGRMGSSRRKAPSGTPSTATNTVSDPSRSARRRTWRTHAGWVPGTIQCGLAQAHLAPVDQAARARGRAPPRTSEGSDRLRPRPVAAVTIALARTCGETWSSEAARRRTSSASTHPRP